MPYYFCNIFMGQSTKTHLRNRILVQKTFFRGVLSTLAVEQGLHLLQQFAILRIKCLVTHLLILFFKLNQK